MDWGWVTKFSAAKALYLELRLIRCIQTNIYRNGSATHPTNSVHTMEGVTMNIEVGFVSRDLVRNIATHDLVPFMQRTLSFNSSTLTHLKTPQCLIYPIPLYIMYPTIHTCGNFCYKMVRCGIWDWYVVGCIQMAYWTIQSLVFLWCLSFGTETQ